MRIGDVIDGKYVVERVLGKGGMGLVVSARHQVLGTRVAIKVLRSSRRDELTTRRFLREARGAGRLRNEHVARVVDCGYADGYPYMAMELVDGPDLGSVIGNGPLAPQLAAKYILQACIGLAEAHEHGIVHRDVKPDNLMLASSPSGEWMVKVVDFGIATASYNDIDNESLTQTNTVVGSVGYMSPEQLRSNREVGPHSDVWGLGITLYELLTGRVPFPGHNYAAVAIAIATEKHVPLYEVDPKLAAIVDRCLQKRIADRYANVWELADALAPFAGVARPRAHDASASSTLRTRKPQGKLAAAIAQISPRTRAVWCVALVAVAALFSFTAVTVADSTPSAPTAIPSAPVAKHQGVTFEPIIVEPTAEPTPVIEATKPAPVARPPARKVGKPARKSHRAVRSAEPKHTSNKPAADPQSCDRTDPRCGL